MREHVCWTNELVAYLAQSVQKYLVNFYLATELTYFRQQDEFLISFLRKLFCQMTFSLDFFIACFTDYFYVFAFERSFQSSSKIYYSFSSFQKPSFENIYLQFKYYQPCY